MLAAMMRFVRALLGDAEAQMRLALENWYGPPQKQNRKWALYWARCAARNGPPEYGLQMAAILASSN
jgi:hypothetical protein